MAHKRNSVEVPELEKLLAGKKKKYVRYEEGRKRNTFATRKELFSTRWAKTPSGKLRRIPTPLSG